LSGLGNVDDQGYVFLNGHDLGAILTQFANNSFSTSDSSFFNSGVNVLLVSDINSGGGPSGAAFYAQFDFSTVSGFGRPLLTACCSLVVVCDGGYHRRITYA